MRKNAALESSNVAVLLEHIPVGQTRSIHSLQVTRVEPDHYSIGGGKVMDLVDAISQIGSYTGHGKVSNPRSLSRPRATAKVSNPQKSERGYFYEVLDSKGRAVMLTTNKAEAAEVASDPIAYKLKKGTYTFRHIGAQSALESPPFRRL
jgi:hypothetical protein